MVEGGCQHVQDQIDASSSKYIWQDDEDKDFAVDTEKPNSCYARYANDFLHAPQWNAELIREGEEIYVAYGQHYWKGSQDLSYNKALMAQQCYNLESVPPYNPYAPSHAKPRRELRTSTETEFTCLLATEVGSHTFLQLPFTVSDVNGGVESL
jgi:hypothetical protein